MNGFFIDFFIERILPREHCEKHPAFAEGRELLVEYLEGGAYLKDVQTNLESMLQHIARHQCFLNNQREFENEYYSGVREGLFTC